jgi:hypothetical protein
MTIEEVIAWFGNLNQACIAIDIASQNMTKWKKQGYIPWKQQFKIATVTEGELLPDDEDPYLIRNPKKPKCVKGRTIIQREMNNEVSSI